MTMKRAVNTGMEIIEYFCKQSTMYPKVHAQEGSQDGQPLDSRVYL